MNFNDNGIWLMSGDCLQKMLEIPDNSVDAIICDPPYGTTGCKWDSVIPLDEMWKQLKRVAKPNAAIVLFSAQPFTSVLVCSNLEMFKYDWCWRKPKGTGHLNAKKQPMRDKEDIVVFYKKQSNYFPQMTDGKPYKNKAGKDHESNSSMSELYGQYTNFRNENTGFRYPKQVIDFGVVERGTVHPTQKPVALMEYLVKTYTNERETVLDFTMGSGTTGVACVNTSREFIGIERDENYFNIAVERINKAKGEST